MQDSLAATEPRRYPLPEAEPGGAAARPQRRASFALLLFLAGRTLKEQRGGLLLLLLAVTAGVGFQVPNLANLSGYREELLDQEIRAGYGHVRVRPRHGDRFRDANAALSAIRRIPGVDEVQPVLTLPGSASHGSHFSLVTVFGVAPGRHRPYELSAGRDLGGGEGLLIGERLAHKLGVGLGDDVDLQVLLATRPRLVLDDGGVGKYTLPVVGLIGGARTDTIMVSQRFLGHELGEEGSASLLVIHGASMSPARAQELARTVERAVPQATALASIDDSRLLRSTSSAIGAVERIVDIMSLFAVGVPVLALLYIDALHRRRQVSLLAAMGFPSSEILTVFLLKAAIVGALGVACGGLLGYGLLLYFHYFPIYHYDDFVIRAVLSVHFVVRPMLLVFLTTVLAGSYPAWRAARVDPSPMLRRME